MSERRMLSKKITDDDNFVSLSASAQALFLHLNMAADDDGFCNQVTASMFKAHASANDLETLINKGYVYQFPSGVVLIMNWRVSNAIRKDRYTHSNFVNEAEKVYIEKNGTYRISTDECDSGCRLVAVWLPSGCHSIGKDRLGKDRLNQDNKKENNKRKNSSDDDYEGWSL